MKKIALVQILTLLLCFVINNNIVYADSDYDRWVAFVNESEELDKASASNASSKSANGELIGDCSVDAKIISPGILEIQIQSKCKNPCDKMYHAVTLQKYDEEWEEYESIKTYEFADYELWYNPLDFHFILGPEHTTKHAIKVGNLDPGTYRVRGLHGYYKGSSFETFNSKSKSTFVLSTPPTQENYAEMFFNTNLILAHETKEAEIMNEILTKRGYLFNSGYNPSAITLLEAFKRDKIVHYLGHGQVGYLDNQFGKVSGKEILANVKECPADFVYLEACLAANPSDEFGDVDDTLFQLGADTTLAFGTTVSAGSDSGGIHYFSTQLFKHMFEDHVNLVVSADFAAQDLYDKYGDFYGCGSREIHGNIVFE